LIYVEFRPCFTVDLPLAGRHCFAFTKSSDRFPLAAIKLIEYLLALNTHESANHAFNNTTYRHIVTDCVKGNADVSDGWILPRQLKSNNLIISTIRFMRDTLTNSIVDPNKQLWCADNQQSGPR